MPAFLDKVKSGKAQSYAGAGFGGKGLDKFDQERDAKERAQRAAYGETVEEKPKVEEETPPPMREDDMTFGNFKVEIRKGPAPDSTKAPSTPAGAAARWMKAKDDEAKALMNLKAAQEAAARITSKDSAVYRQAQSVIAKFNAQLRATKLMVQSQVQLDDVAGRKPKDPDATDFHAIIPINDYPQKARWRVTNKETMVQVCIGPRMIVYHLLICLLFPVDRYDGCFCYKQRFVGAQTAFPGQVSKLQFAGIYYEPGKEPPPEGPPKLHLLVESNDEFRVRCPPLSFSFRALISLASSGRAGCAGNQTTPHRGLHCRARSRTKKSKRHGWAI